MADYIEAWCIWSETLSVIPPSCIMYPLQIINTYTEAVQTVAVEKAVGKPHNLWVNFAKFYEENGQLPEVCLCVCVLYMDMHTRCYRLELSLRRLQRCSIEQWTTWPLSGASMLRWNWGTSEWSHDSHMTLDYLHVQYKHLWFVSHYHTHTQEVWQSPTAVTSGHGDARQKSSLSWQIWASTEQIISISEGVVHVRWSWRESGDFWGEPSSWWTPSDDHYPHSQQRLCTTGSLISRLPHLRLSSILVSF